MTTRRALMAGGLAGAVYSSASAQPWPTQSWQTDAPANQGFDPAEIASLDAWCMANNTKALLIERGGYLVHESYGNGGGPAVSQDTQSIAKSFLTMAAGVAIDEGHIPSRNALISQWFPAIDQIATKNQIEIGHLLNMTSGIDFNNATHYPLMLAAHDWAEYVLARPMEKQPGTWWRYTAGLQILSKIITIATGLNARDYLASKALAPIGVAGFTWEQDPAGHTNGSGGFSTTAQNYLRIGHLMLRRGEWDGQRIVSEQWIAGATQPCQAAKRMFNNCWTAAGMAKNNPLEYGDGWWCRKWDDHAQWDATRPDVFYAFGGYGNFIIVIPSLDTVLVRLGTQPQGVLYPNQPDTYFLVELLNRLDRAAA